VQEQDCNLLSIDPRYSIGAGSMLITCTKGKEQEVINRLKKEDIACTAVGEMTEQEEGIKLLKEGVKKELPYPGEDPYWNAFFRAYKAGWK
jgi:hydrogenase maturation factor